MQDELERLPSDSAYSPLWLVNVYDNADFDSVSNLQSAQEANILDTGVATVNCPISGTVGGADTLNLQGATHNLATIVYNVNGNTATRPIISEITIVGDVGGTTVARTGAEQYRLFQVETPGHLTLQNVTVTNGHSTIGGGAVFNRGVLTLTTTTLFSNTAENGGDIFNFDGTAIILDETPLAAQHPGRDRDSRGSRASASRTPATHGVVVEAIAS